MENGPFEDVFPMKTCGYSIDALVYQRVSWWWLLVTVLGKCLGNYPRGWNGSIYRGYEWDYTLYFPAIYRGYPCHSVYNDRLGALLVTCALPWYQCSPETVWKRLCPWKFIKAASPSRNNWKWIWLYVPITKELSNNSLKGWKNFPYSIDHYVQKNHRTGNIMPKWQHQGDEND